MGMSRVIDWLIRWIDPGEEPEPEEGGPADIEVLRSMAEQDLPVSTPDPKLSAATGLPLHLRDAPPLG